MLRGVFLVTVGISLSGWDYSHARPSYQLLIPNGGKVPHPCDKTTTWPGVGHELVQGQGPLNRFGKDFANNGFKWTASLCKADSDGDGKSNGQELGDPNCVWFNSSTTPTVTNPAQLSHPGVCEPINSSLCTGSNSFLSSIDICAAALNATSANANWCPAIKSSDVKTLDLTFNRTIVPSNETTYYCQQFNVPNDDTYHIIAWEPIIDNYELLHHIVVYTCNADAEKNLAKKSYPVPGTCAMAPPECPDMAFVWAFGQGKRCYSDAVGIPMGKNEYKIAIVQLHYNNPSLKANIIDSSGIRLYYTNKRRPNDGGMLNVGQMDIIVPPKQRVKVNASAFTTESCKTSALGTKGRYYLNSMLFHMHKAGVHGRLTIKKANGRDVVVADQDVEYDRPLMMTWNNNANAPMIEPGDNLEIECTFQSESSTDYIFFGEKTHDEMCFAFIELYPRPQNRSCQQFFSFDDLCGACLYDGGHLSTKALHDCPDADKFSNHLYNDIFQTPHSGDFMKYCRSNVYPATTCSKDCYTFLKSYNLLQDRCMQGSVFRFYAGFQVSDSVSDVYWIQSQTDQCIWLKDASQSDGSSGNSAGSTTQALAAETTTKETKKGTASSLQVPAKIVLLLLASIYLAAL